jgi:hypothetical protein
MNWYGIWVLKTLGLAHDVKRHKLADLHTHARTRPNPNPVVTEASRAAAPIAVLSGD